MKFSSWTRCAVTNQCYNQLVKICCHVKQMTLRPSKFQAFIYSFQHVDTFICFMYNSQNLKLHPCYTRGAISEDAVTWQSNKGMSTYKACHKPCILLKSHILQMFHGWSYKPRCPPGGTHALGKERMWLERWVIRTRESHDSTRTATPT